MNFIKHFVRFLGVLSVTVGGLVAFVFVMSRVAGWAEWQSWFKSALAIMLFVVLLVSLVMLIRASWEASRP